MTKSHITNVSAGQLFDQWQMYELRQRYWEVEQINGDSDASGKVINYQLLINEIREELARRLDDKVPINFLLMLINTGSSFRINI